jgi:hypothetical protein
MGWSEEIRRVSEYVCKWWESIEYMNTTRGQRIVQASLKFLGAAAIIYVLECKTDVLADHLPKCPKN